LGDKKDLARGLFISDKEMPVSLYNLERLKLSAVDGRGFDHEIIVNGEPNNVMATVVQREDGSIQLARAMAAAPEMVKILGKIAIFFSPLSNEHKLDPPGYQIWDEAIDVLKRIDL
jgi:hypothetical protein